MVDALMRMELQYAYVWTTDNRQQTPDNHPNCDTICDTLDCPSKDGHCVKYDNGVYGCAGNIRHDNYPICADRPYVYTGEKYLPYHIKWVTTS